MSLLRREGPFPLRFGGGPRVVTQERDAMKLALRKGYDVEDAAFDVECHAHALALDMIWAANRRLENQAIPGKMLEALPDWENILELTPTPADSDQRRRASVGGKLRGLAGNAMIDIEDASRRVLGANYVEVRLNSAADATTYWPGMNPGPPGREWSSTTAQITVVMNKVGLSDDDVAAKRAKLAEVLDAMLPVWMTFVIGSDGASGNWIVNQGILGQTLF